MENLFKLKRKKSIFRAIFVPLIFVMILQSIIFYFSTIYGGVEESINQNAADVFMGQLTNRKNELEATYNNKWIYLETCESKIQSVYEKFECEKGELPFVDDTKTQIDFLGEVSETLFATLRSNQVSGIFLILNDEAKQTTFKDGKPDDKYGLCIIDSDPTSTFVNRDDLLIRRSPSALVEQMGCSLDSWWEAKYLFKSEKDGAFYYEPLNAAWENKGALSKDLGYFCLPHSESSASQEVVSHSIPLTDSEGRPYAVLGIEISTKYLESFIPSSDLSSDGNASYVLAMHNKDKGKCIPFAYNGTTFSRYFEIGKVINCDKKDKTGGFDIHSNDNTKFYGVKSDIHIYNNNNPFEDDQLTIMAIEKHSILFSYSYRIKVMIFTVSALSLILGIICILFVSRRFSSPITDLAKKAENVTQKTQFKLEHINIKEIDQLVDSIETLNENVSKEIARTEFFSRMSHDMRTPMNAIISFSSKELLENKTEKEKEEYLQKIHSSSEYLLGLINEVLDITKIESDKVELRYKVLPVSSIWDTVITVVDELAKKNNIQFVKNVPYDNNDKYNIDSQHISQIIMNILSNAIKFTKNGGMVSLDIYIVPTDDNNVDCNITIKDTGVGMSKEFMQKLYDPFEQENTDFEGTGLGLTISKKLVTLMNGTIECISEKNVGTEFYITIPLEKAKEGDLIESEELETLSQEECDKILDGKHILVCEDHPMNAQIAKMLLERKNVKVDVEVDGQKGFERFMSSSENEYDAILMDIRMPVLDGLATTKAIRSLKREDAKTIPIIAMTADAFADSVMACKEVGMNAHLAKPINPGKVYSTLSEYISRR